MKSNRYDLNTIFLNCCYIFWSYFECILVNCRECDTLLKLIAIHKLFPKIRIAGKLYRCITALKYFLRRHATRYLFDQQVQLNFQKDWFPGKCFVKNLQKQPPKMFSKKIVLKNFAIFTGKDLCWSLFFNEDLWTSFLKKICEKMLLN